MTVTLTDLDVTQPLGELDSSLFPGSNFAELVNGWLYQAQQKVEANADIDTANQNDAAAAWVYYRAGMHIANRLAASASSRRLGPASQSMDADQRAYWLQYAKDKLAEYTGYDASIIVSLASDYSASIPTVAVW